MNHEMMTIAIEIVGKFAISLEGEYPEYFFSDLVDGEAENKHVTRRMKERNSYPLKAFHLNWYKKASESSDLLNNDSIDYEGEYKTTLDKFKRIMILTFENLYDVMLGEIKSINEEDIKRLKIEDKKQEQKDIENLKSNITLEKKEEHLELFRNQDFPLLFADILQMFFYGPILNKFDQTFLSKFFSWDKLSRLNSNFSTNSKVKLFRNYLVTMGVVPFDFKTDQEHLRHSRYQTFISAKKSLFII
jgi:hypothetical protein